MVKIGVLGASGFTGTELLRLIAGHPQLELVLATGETAVGERVGDLYPSLAAAYPDLRYCAYATEAVVEAGCELVFLALPHGQSQHLVPQLRGKVAHIVDLAADFRLRDPGAYPRWYGEEHLAPELLGEFVYGLPELFRDQIVGAELIAVPGCYPTAASLALAPLQRAGLIDSTGIIVDAASGVSGAGKGKFPFCGTNEDFTAYGLLDHRHTPEIEANLQGVSVLFTPHLAPMNRGILATCYARPCEGAGSMETGFVLDCLSKAYANEPFIVVSERPPSTKATLGSNSVHLTARADPRTGWIVALAAIDNICKGASGQAIQCANLALGIDETTGLSTIGVFP